jgi:predicted nucleic acid-binding protein
LGLSELDSFLGRHERIALDTSVFIYHLESNPRYVQPTELIFGWLENPTHRAVTSTITMAELLVRPYRMLDQRGVDSFYALLSTYPNLEWIAPDLQIASLAARIRAASQLKIPDALQAATAVRERAAAILTNDPTFERVAEVRALVLDRFL